MNEFERIIISSSPKTGLLESNISSDVTHCSKEAGLRPSMERARLESFQVTQCLRPTVRQISNSFRHQHTRKIFLTNTMSHVPSSSGQYRNRPTLMKSSMAMPTGGPSLFASRDILNIKQFKNYAAAAFGWSDVNKGDQSNSTF